MRLVGLTVLAMALSGFCGAQQFTEPETAELKLPSGWSAEFIASPPEDKYDTLIIKRPGKPDKTIWVAKGYGCASIRAYHFERNGSESPRMTGETACTFSDKSLLRWIRIKTKSNYWAALPLVIPTWHFTSDNVCYRQQ